MNWLKKLWAKWFPPKKTLKMQMVLSDIKPITNYEGDFFGWVDNPFTDFTELDGGNFYLNSW